MLFQALRVCRTTIVRQAWERGKALTVHAWVYALTDGLLHLFAAQDAPLRSLRNVGMSAVDRLGPVKRWLTARALDA